MPTVLPHRLEDPDGLVLRRWEPADAEALGRAVTQSADHLRPWMAWIAHEPVPLESRREMIAEWEQDWSQGGDVVMGVFVDGRVAGGCGLHHRIGGGGLEIGYWIHAAFLRRGLATRTARTLTGAALALPEINRVEIHHDKANRASAGVPRKLGFEWLGESPDAPDAPADLGVEWRWRMERRPGPKACEPPCARTVSPPHPPTASATATTDLIGAGSPSTLARHDPARSVARAVGSTRDA